jgi:hypothetical protein
MFVYTLVSISTDDPWLLGLIISKCIILELRNTVFSISILDNNTCVDIAELKYFMFKVAHDSEFALRTLSNETVSTKWDFSGAFSFVITVVSTIGKYYIHEIHTLNTLCSCNMSVIDIYCPQSWTCRNNFKFQQYRFLRDISISNKYGLQGRIDRGYVLSCVIVPR